LNTVTDDEADPAVSVVEAGIHLDRHGQMCLRICLRVRQSAQSRPLAPLLEGVFLGSGTGQKCVSSPVTNDLGACRPTGVNRRHRHRPSRRAAATDATPAWAMEAFALARRDAYGLLPPGDLGTYSLPPAYMEQAARDVALQFSRAGVRLAPILNQALGASLQVRKTCVSSRLSGKPPSSTIRSIRVIFPHGHDNPDRLVRLDI
jgi:hypothetical protein